MNDVERDEVVARALRELPVPEHREGFWAELEQKFGEPGPIPLAKGAVGSTTGELPSVTSLAERPTRPRRLPLYAGAAAAVVLIAAVSLVLLGGDGGGDGDETEFAQSPEVSTEATEGEGSTDETVAPTTTTPPAPPVDDVTTVATTWLDALAAGEIDEAVALTGPRTRAYVESTAPGTTLEGFLTESQATYAAWADTEGREVTATMIGPMEFDGATMQVVVVTGTDPADGATMVEVLPVVNDGQVLLVEPLAFSTTRDNDPVFTVPDETDAGLADVGPEAEINVFVPTDGTVYFLVDHTAPGSDTTSTVAGEPFALYDPPGDLAPGEHQLVVVAVGDDGTIAHFGGTFDVAA